MSITATGDLPALTPEAPAAEAARMIAARGVGAIPVQDRSGRVVGVVSERDIVRVVATRAQGIRGLSVEEVMTRDPVAVRPGTPRETALEVMRRVGVRHLPVCCAEGRLVGLMGLEDVARPV
ncbi:CBS domain-containing protein [Falsiroseomonas oryziterrae]|uniref:CBS domain-containing protein n=1 Tax=Falsiroseomonas oryziterrae TaxID=2911368 RepID=UPI001F2A33F4|nr:CBS domain-containing protein [Roseomonas sp. NPKOSM-4]